MKRRNYPQTYEYNGREYTVAELAGIAGITAQSMYYRLSTRKTIEDCLAKKLSDHGGNPPKTFEINGHKFTLKELVELSKINKHTIVARLRLGFSVIDACTFPVRHGGGANRGGGKKEDDKN